MPTRPPWPLLALAVGLAAGLAWLLFDVADAPAPSEVASAPSVSGAPPAAGPGSAASSEEASAAAAKRTHVPKPAAIHPKPRSSVPVASNPGGIAAQGGDPRVEAIQDAMKDVTADVRDCLNQWWAVDPTLNGKVVVSFDIAPDGLKDVWIEDHTDVPLGPLSCFSAGVYGVDWSGIVDGETTVTYPIVFSSGIND